MRTAGTNPGGSEGSAYQDQDGYIVLGDGESSAPQGTLSITADGSYDVSDYAMATVAVVKTYTATISGSGHNSKCCVKKNNTGTAYYTNGDTFTFTDNDDLSISYASASTSYDAYLMVNGVVIDNTITGVKTYTVTKPRADVTIELAYSTTSDVTVNIVTSVVTITSKGFSPVGGRVFAEVDVGELSETELKAYIQRNNTFTDINWPDGLTKIGTGAFADCVYFNPSKLPDTVTEIGPRAFMKSNTNATLSLTSLPSGVTSIGEYAFYGNPRLALTSLPSGIVVIYQYTFYNCTNLALTSLPSGIVSIGSSAFFSCRNVAFTSLPSSLKTISSDAFRGAGITSISCDGAITSFQNNAFTGNSTYSSLLTSASFPNMALTSTIGSAFGSTTAAYACQLLEFCDIGSTTGIGSSAFANCYSLATLVLRKTASVCTLSNVSAFTNTPMSGYNNQTGTVYVPSALIDSYKTATNWSTLYNNGTVTFEAIEGSDYELE